MIPQVGCGRETKTIARRLEFELLNLRERLVKSLFLKPLFQHCPILTRTWRLSKDSNNINDRIIPLTLVPKPTELLFCPKRETSVLPCDSSIFFSYLAISNK